MVGNPIRTQDFLAAVGFDTHIAYTDGGYANIANIDADMAYLGISNIRDGISNGSYGSAPVSSYINAAQHGGKFTFIVGAAGGIYTKAVLQAQLAMFDQVNQAVPGSVVAIEGPNEINNQPLNYNGVSGEQGAEALQRDLYSLVHADTNLSGAKVDYFTGYGTTGNGAGSNPATTSGLADFDNQHPYPNFGQQPAFWVNPAFALSNETTSFSPFVYTETGYSTNGGTSGAVNADVQAKQSLNLLMDAAKDGSSKTFLYQLLDAYQPGSPQGDDGFGLFDTSNNPKPVATAIHNLAAILRDAGASAATFAPSASNSTVSGLSSTGNSLALAKSDGTQDIVVWDEKPLWNNSNGTEMSPASTSATVSLGRTYAAVNVYDPLTGTTPLATYRNVSSVPLSLGASPLIVEMEPQAMTNVPATYNWNPTAQLTHFIAAGKRAVIEAVGDSTTLGFGSASQNFRAASYPTDLASDLSAAGFPAQSDNFTGDDTSVGNADSRVTLVGGASLAYPQVPGNYNIATNAAGQGFDFKLPAPAAYDHVSVSYIDAGQGTFTVSLDGGPTLGTVSVGGTNAIKTATFAVPLGQHNEISVRATNSNTVYLDGAGFSNSVAPSISVINAGIGGATAPSNVDSNGNPATSYGKFAGDVALSPNLVLIDYGINDINTNVPLSQTVAAEKTMVDAFKAANEDPVLVIPEPIAGSSYTNQIGAFRSAIDNLALQENVGVIDLSATYGDDWTKLQALGELTGDNLHPNAAGYADIASKDAALLATVMTASPSAPVVVAPPPTPVPTPPAPTPTPPAPTPTPTPTPTPIATGGSMQPVMLGSGPDTLALLVSEDAWQGNATFTVSIDGVQVGGVQTATSLHSAQADQTFDIAGNFAGTHTASVNFLNDAWGGTPTTDRNLYVDGASVDNAIVSGAQLTLLSGGPQSLAFQGPSTSPVAIPVPPSGGTQPVVLGSGADTLALSVSEDAWMGDANFTVSVDGAQIGGVETVTSLHSAQADQVFDIRGNFAGAHTATVNFLNDAWGGTPTTDRNLYVDGASIDTVAVPGARLALLSGGPQSFAFRGTTGTSVGQPVMLLMREDAWNGDAQFTVSVNGAQIGGINTETTTHGDTPFSLGTLAPGSYDVAVDFLNDAWGFTPTTDRNLYVDGVTVGGVAQAGASLALYSTGTQHLSIAVPAQ